MEPEEWLAAIKSESEVIASTDPGALSLAVPTCPEWTVHDLIGHVGAVHRWAADRLNGTRLYRGYDGIEVPDGAAVIGWYAQGRDGLVDALTARDADEPVSTFVGERTVAFWYRRQAHEIAVHRWDLESATVSGHQQSIPPELAADGIEEWFEVFAPRFIANGPGVPADLVGRSMHLHATDIEQAGTEQIGTGEWFVDVTADGFDWRREHAKADVALRGPASDLLLALWHRVPPETLDIVGDTALVAPLLDLVHVT